MKTWTLEGPDQQLLTKQQVWQYLGISEGSLDKLIASGRFPRGINVGGTKKPMLKWLGLDVAAYLHFCDRLRIAPLESYEAAEPEE